MEAKLKAEKAKKAWHESLAVPKRCEAFEKKLEEEKKRLEAKREAQQLHQKVLKVQPP